MLPALLLSIAAIAAPTTPTPITLNAPEIAQTLVNPADPRINKLFDLQRDAFIHAKRELRLGRSARVTISRFQGYQEWGAAIVEVQESRGGQGYQVTIVMQWDSSTERWEYRGMVDGADSSALMSVGMPAENAYWTADRLLSF